MSTCLIRPAHRAVVPPLLALAAGLAAACGSSSSAPAEVPTGDVHGTLVNTHVDPAGVRTTAVAPGATTSPPTVEVAALSPATGGYHRYSGTVSANGDFIIPGVEPGSYLLEVKGQPSGVRYVELSARQVDLGLEIFGSTAAAAGAGTGCALAVDGLDPSASSSLVYAFVAGSTIPIGFSAAAGSTSLSATLPLAGNPMPGPSAQGWAFQQATAPPPGGLTGTYRTTGRAGSFSVNAMDGMNTPVALTLTAPPVTGALSASWRTGDYEAYAAQMAPTIASSGHVASVRAYPYGLPGAPSLPAPIPTLASLNVPAGAGTVSTTGVQWGRFLPSGWQEYLTAGFTVTSAYTAPGATASSNLGVTVTTTDLVSAAATLTPRTSPPRRPTVAGRDAMVAQSGVGTTPRLAWDAPDMGDTGNFMVTAYALVNSSGATTFSQIASFRLRNRHLDVPPGLLQAGTSYVATIVSINTPTFDWSKPLQQRVPNATASVTLAAFTP